MPEAEDPFKPGDRVIADTAVDLWHPSNHLWVHAMPTEAWKYPLSDDLVAELATVAKAAYFRPGSYWEEVIRAIFARLMDGATVARGENTDV